ncbi:MAG: RNA-binding protein [Acidimicrobiia bacterium]
MQLFVGNLPWGFSSEDLQRLFAEYGNVDAASVIRDRATGRSRGFGFVSMSSARHVESAIEALNGSTVRGREIKVNPAWARATEGSKP